MGDFPSSGSTEKRLRGGREGSPEVSGVAVSVGGRVRSVADGISLEDAVVMGLLCVVDFHSTTCSRSWGSSNDQSGPPFSFSLAITEAFSWSFFESAMIGASPRSSRSAWAQALSRGRSGRPDIRRDIQEAKRSAEPALSDPRMTERAGLAGRLGGSGGVGMRMARKDGTSMRSNMGPWSRRSWMKLSRIGAFWKGVIRR